MNNTNTQTNTNKTLLRNARGQFISNHNHTIALRRDKNGKFVGAGAPVASALIKSSFILKLNINPNNTVDVVMQRNPKIVYTYKPNAQGLANVKKALSTGTSLGHAYNENLKGHEISRTIFK